MKKFFALLLVALLVGCAANEEAGVVEVIKEVPVEVEVPVETIVEVPVEVVTEITGGVDIPDIPETNRKIIYRADMTVDTFDIEQYHKELNLQVALAGGYYQSENTTDTKLKMVVRVPSENLTSFLNNLKESGKVTYFNKTSEDVTNAYSTLEARKQALEAKQARLIELLEAAATIEDVVEIERELSYTESQLISIGISMTSYDSLVDYSTVSLTVNQVDLDEYNRLPMGEKVRVDFRENTSDSMEFRLVNNHEETIDVEFSIYLKDELVETKNIKVYSLTEEQVIFENLESNSDYKFIVQSSQVDHELPAPEISRFGTLTTYGDDVSSTFMNSLNMLWNFLEGLFIFLVGASPFLVIAGVIAYPIYKLQKRRPRIQKPKQEDKE